MRSQRHLLDTRGIDSAVNIKGLGHIVNNSCEVANGANTAPATIQLNGYFAAGKSVSVDVAHNTTTSTVTYTPTAQEDAVQLASNLAAAIEADTTVGGLVTATSAVNIVSVVNQSTATNGDTVSLSNLVIQ